MAVSSVMERELFIKSMVATFGQSDHTKEVRRWHLFFYEDPTDVYCS
jgi:hypothetical protein